MTETSIALTKGCETTSQYSECCCWATESTDVRDSSHVEACCKWSRSVGNHASDMLKRWKRKSICPAASLITPNYVYEYLLMSDLNVKLYSECLINESYTKIKKVHRSLTTHLNWRYTGKGKPVSTEGLQQPGSLRSECKLRPKCQQALQFEVGMSHYPSFSIMSKMGRTPLLQYAGWLTPQCLYNSSYARDDAKPPWASKQPICPYRKNEITMF